VKFVAKPNHGRHRRNRNKSGRDHFAADQCVEKGRFATLKLTYTSYIETSFGDPHSELPCFLGDGLCPKLLSQFAELQ
jgi:hypothetical protein